MNMDVHHRIRAARSVQHQSHVHVSSCRESSPYVLLDDRGTLSEHSSHFLAYKKIPGLSRIPKMFFQNSVIVQQC